VIYIKWVHDRIVYADAFCIAGATLATLEIAIHSCQVGAPIFQRLHHSWSFMAISVVVHTHRSNCYAPAVPVLGQQSLQSRAIFGLIYLDRHACVVLNVQPLFLLARGNLSASFTQTGRCSRHKSIPHHTNSNIHSVGFPRSLPSFQHPSLSIQSKDLLLPCNISR